MSTNVIEAERLGKRYVIGSRESYATLRGALAATFSWSSRSRAATSQVWALRDVALAVEQGDVLGVIGSNGAGKTTTIRMITGIFLPDSGSIEWTDGDRTAQDRIGYLPEERGLYRQMKIIELLLFLVLVLVLVHGQYGPAEDTPPGAVSLRLPAGEAQR